MVTNSIAAIIIPIFSPSGCSTERLIRIEIVPGPAKSGIARGLKEMSSFTIDSCMISPLTSLLCFALSSKNPERDIIIPPAIFNALMDIPKKMRICEPIKNEQTHITRMYMQVFLICKFLHFESWCSVSEINTGNAPKGLIRAKREMRLAIKKEMDIVVSDCCAIILFGTQQGVTDLLILQ